MYMFWSYFLFQNDKRFVVFTQQIVSGNAMLLLEWDTLSVLGVAVDRRVKCIEMKLSIRVVTELTNDEGNIAEPCS